MLRSIRLGEADRVLHLYTRDHGRVGAVAKGVRRTRSRFGGRLEPFFRLALRLYQGRSELHTVTQVETVESYPRLRERGPSLTAAAAACESVLRLFDDGESSPAAYNLLCRELQLLDADPAAACPSNMLAFRLKLLMAAGFLPEIAACAHCGTTAAGLRLRFSAAAGGVVCPECVAGAGEGFELSGASHRFMAACLQAPLRDAPIAPPPAISQVDRVVTGTLEYHAHVRLRSVA